MTTPHLLYSESRLANDDKKLISRAARFVAGGLCNESWNRNRQSSRNISRHVIILDCFEIMSHISAAGMNVRSENINKCHVGRFTTPTPRSTKCIPVP